MQIEQWLNETQWLGNSLWAWGIAVAWALLGFIVVRFVIGILAGRLARLAQRRPDSAIETLAHALKGTRNWLLLLAAILVATRFLDIPERLDIRLAQLAFFLIALQLGMWLTRLIEGALNRADRRSLPPRNPVIIGILSWSTQLLVWTVVLLAVLDNAGVNVDAFIASLGIGGIAVALAAQSILGDLMASLSIGLDKPFSVGDSITFSGNSGTVKRVGIKSTRIQSLSGEEIAIGNAALLKDLIRNLSRMEERRIVFPVRLAIDTPRASAERFVADACAIITTMDAVRFDRGHMTGFGETSLDFEFVYYVLNPGFAVYRDIQQQINFQLMDLIERMQLALAVPRRELHDKTTKDVPQASS